MIGIRSSGIQPGERRLNGQQTTGRDYRNLSPPAHAMISDDDVVVPMRDGVALLADVHRPAEPFLAVSSSQYRSAIRSHTAFPWCPMRDALELDISFGSISPRMTKTTMSPLCSDSDMPR
jgi:hypothetical protein